MPTHIANDIIENPDKKISSCTDLHKHVGVMFAVIPELKKLNLDIDKNKEDMEQMQNLQTVLCKLDENLNTERFSSLEKIKTIGSVYMVASGLHEGTSNS